MDSDSTTLEDPDRAWLSQYNHSLLLLSEDASAKGGSGRAGKHGGSPVRLPPLMLKMMLRELQDIAGRAQVDEHYGVALSCGPGLLGKDREEGGVKVELFADGVGGRGKGRFKEEDEPSAKRLKADPEERTPLNFEGGRMGGGGGRSLERGDKGAGMPKSHSGVDWDGEGGTGAVESSGEDLILGAAVWDDAQSCDVCFQKACSAFDPVSQGFGIQCCSRHQAAFQLCASSLVS